MARALPSAIPPKMYRHFALFTVALTTGIAMFADGENREAAAAQVEEHREQEAIRQASEAKTAKPTIARRTASPHHRFAPESEGFDESFGAPMELPTGWNVAAGMLPTGRATEATQAGYSEGYLASLEAQERDLLLKGLEHEGLLSSDERERRIAALSAASQARSGASSADY